MKKIIYLFAFLCSVNLLLAQAPQSMNYQGVARKASGEPLLGKVIKIRFSIVDATPTTLYSETHSVTTNQQTGIFSLSIGAGTPVTGTFAAIDWTSGSRSLKIEMDENGGNNFTLVGTNPFQSVPYALYAEKTKEKDIAIFEERYAWGQSHPAPTTQWNTRFLNTVVYSSVANSVQLVGNNIKFNKTGTYHIIASASAYQTNRHRLCLRTVNPSSPSTILSVVMYGASEFAPIDNAPAPTRSLINGVFVVTASNINFEYKLDHYLQTLTYASSPGGFRMLGWETLLPAPDNTSHETFAQITIEKLK